MSEEIQSPEAIALYKKKERALLWKIDLMLMPILTITFGLQYYDKAVLGSASIFGIINDLDLSTTTNGVTSTLRYSTATAAFYYGYIVSVLPIALLLSRFPIVKSLSAAVLIWGIVCILTVVCTNYPGFVVQRVVLGLVEAAVSPGFVALTTLWYKKEEQTTRLGIWYSATGIFSMFSGVVNYGLGSSKSSIAVWKLMYLFAGSVTIVWSAVLLFFVPTSPSNPGKRFTEEERQMLIARSASNHTGKDETALKWSQVKEAALDYKIYMFMLMGAATYVCNGGNTAFGARIVSSFGYTSLQTIVITIPGGAFTAVSLYGFGWLAGRFPNIRTILIPISTIPVIVGSVIIWKGSWDNKGLPLFGYYLIPTFGTPYVLTLSLSAANIAGGTKKAIATGAIFIGYNVGNIVGSYIVFTPEKAVHYQSTWIGLIVCMCFVATSSLVLRFLMSRENARRDALYGPVVPAAAIAEGSESEKEKVGEEASNSEDVTGLFTDLTDKEQTSFRYSL